MERKNKARFLKVICFRCGNSQMVFGKSTTKVKCLNCNKLLVRSTGGKVRIRTIIRKVLKPMRFGI